MVLLKYLKKNYVQGLMRLPEKGWRVIPVGIVLFSLGALPPGLIWGIFSFQVFDSGMAFILPFTLFVFPAFLEESFFRGFLIPLDSKERGLGFCVFVTLMSALVFTLWHPFNAVTVNPGAEELFLNPLFLVIVFWLGVVLSVSYILSKSLWAPVVIHWLTVLVWVLFLNGRNLIVE